MLASSLPLSLLPSRCPSAYPKNSLTSFSRYTCVLLLSPFSLSSLFSAGSALLRQKHPGWHTLPQHRGHYSYALFTSAKRNSKKTRQVSPFLSITWIHASAPFFTLKKINCLFLTTSEKHRGWGYLFHFYLKMEIYERHCSTASSTEQ